MQCRVLQVLPPHKPASRAKEETYTIVGFLGFVPTMDSSNLPETEKKNKKKGREKLAINIFVAPFRKKNIYLF